MNCDTSRPSEWESKYLLLYFWKVVEQNIIFYCVQQILNDEYSGFLHWQHLKVSLPYLTERRNHLLNMTLVFRTWKPQCLQWLCRWGHKTKYTQKTIRELWLCSCPCNEIALWQGNWARKAAAVPHLCIQMHSALLVLTNHYSQLRLHHSTEREQYCFGSYCVSKISLA